MGWQNNRRDCRSRIVIEMISKAITAVRYLAALASISALGASVSVFGQIKKLTAREAKDHIGQQATVCGTVAGWRHLGASWGNPISLDLDKLYPNEPFSVVIWARNRTKFRDPEDYRNRNICVTGRIGSHRGKAEMIISDPSRLTTDVEQSER